MKRALRPNNLISILLEREKGLAGKGKGFFLPVVHDVKIYSREICFCEGFFLLCIMNLLALKPYLVEKKGLKSHHVKQTHRSHL